MSMLSGTSVFGLFALLGAVFLAVQRAAPPQVQSWLCSHRAVTEFRIPALYGAQPISYLCNQWSHDIRNGAAPVVQEEELGCSDSSAQTRCQYMHVDNMNMQLLPLLDSLRKTAFFRFFKVSLYKDCPFWDEDGTCSNQACSVCECEDSDVPKAWRDGDGDDSADDTGCQKTKLDSKAEEDATVNVSLSESTSKQLLSLPGWKGMDNPWLPDTQEDGELEYSYVNLLLNPERYTGYKGEHAHRIWNWIYTQDCFDSVRSTPETCDQEYKVFYRIVSGVHTSISAHIAKEYLLDERLEHWGPNLRLFRERMGDPSKAEHVQNLYFVYLFVLQAVMKAAPVLREVHYYTGDQNEDVVTQDLMQRILSHEAFQNACPLPFDVGRLWKGESGPDLKLHLQSNFQNITQILDCVGCEKCKLWGKLQFLGIATSLKILFSSDDCDGSQPPQDDPFKTLKLERNEVIALFNLLHRLSESIEVYRSMSLEIASEGVTRCCLSTSRIF